MALGSHRHNRRKYSKDSTEHILFISVILLAAIFYSKDRIIRDYGIIKPTLIIILTLGLILSIAFLKKFVVHAPTHKLLKSSIDNMSGIEFERYVAKLLIRQGYKHIKLTEHYDLGVDIIAEKGNQLWGIQVKRYSGLVKIAAVRQVVAALNHYGCDRAMVITNNNFSLQAINLAKSNNCTLVDQQQLMSWAKDI